MSFMKSVKGMTKKQQQKIIKKEYKKVVTEQTRTRNLRMLTTLDYRPLNHSASRHCV